MVDQIDDYRRYLASKGNTPRHVESRAQELARHSTPTLTIGRYAHARLHDLTAALDSLPDLAMPPETKITPQAVATGTDAQGLKVDSLRGQYTANRRKTVRIVANGPTIATGQKNKIATFRKSFAWRTLTTRKGTLRNVAKAEGTGVEPATGKAGI